MEGRGKVVCLVLGGLGLVAVIAGFVAEAKMVKVGDVEIDVSTAKCLYPRSPAHALGIAAMVILCVIQFIVNITAGCTCCRRKSPNDEILNANITLQRLFAVLSWITFVVAFTMFLMATLLNRESNRATVKGAFYYCYVVKPGVFAGASLLTLSCVSCGIGYFNLVFKAPPPGNMNNGAPGQYQPGFIPVAHPQQQYGA